MGFLDQLVASPQDPTLQFNLFLTSYRRGLSDIHLFMEGRDDPAFYLPHIERAIHRKVDVHTYRVKNKAGVLEAHRDYAARFCFDVKVMFFVDKDLQDFNASDPVAPSDPQVHVTEGYSIENYLWDPVCVRRHCIEIMGLHEGDPVVEQISQQFLNSKLSFEQTLLPVMAWIVAARRAGASLVLDELRLPDIVDFDSNLVARRRLHGAALGAFLARTLRASKRPNFVDVAAARRDLFATDSQRWVRGKYALWHLVAFVERVAGAMRANCKASKVPFRCSVQITASTAVNWFSSRIPTPPTLATFMARAA